MSTSTGNVKALLVTVVAAMDPCRPQVAAAAHEAGYELV
jgi:hypothetical protein